LTTRGEESRDRGEESMTGREESTARGEALRCKKEVAASDKGGEAIRKEKKCILLDIQKGENQ